MIGVDPLTVSAFMVLAASSGQNLCVMPKSAEINVIPYTEEIQVITSKTLAELQNVKTDTVNPHGFGGVSVLQGYASGSIAMKAQVKLGYKHMPQYGAYCLWYDRIDVHFEIDPYIYIAKEVAQDKCMGAAVLAHERKHVNVDRQVVNKYAAVIGQKLTEGIKARGGFIVGPIKQENAKTTADVMQKVVMQIVELEHQRMDLDRRDMQGRVDTREEYESVSAQCPDFRMAPDVIEAGRNRRR